MLLYHILLLALVQGIAEFLPISSSGHLVLLHSYLDANAAENAEANRLIDIAMHIGTLLAVVVYFHQDVKNMILGTFDLIRRKPFDQSENAQLVFYVLIGSLPILVIGGIVFQMDPEWFYNPKIIAFTTIIFGILLAIADRKPSERTVEDITLRDALIVGFAQTIALIPGVSRSGITMTASRFLKLERPQAARYSLLLSMVATAAVGAVGILKILQTGNVALSYDALIAGTVAFVVGFLVIAFMMKFLQRFSFMPFVIYRLFLGAGLLFYLFVWPEL